MNKGETRLGKGLGALLGDYVEEEREAAAEREVSLALIRPNPYQPRGEFHEEALDALAESIRENGLLQPVVVRPAAAGWEVVAGERRWRALRRLGWEKVPVVVRDLSDEQMLVLALVENLQREDLSPLEEARGYQQLVDRFGLTQQEVAERVGRDRSTVANILRLLTLPEAVREMVASRAISAGHGRAILGLEDEEAQVALAEEVVARGLSVRETEARVRTEREPAEDEEEAPSRDPGLPPTADPAVRRAEQVLERALGTQVTVRSGAGGRGEIRIRFHDSDDFGRLLALLAGDAASDFLDLGR